MTVKTENPPQGLSLWIAATRPRTLTIAAAPVIAATALAFFDLGAINWVILVAVMACAVAIQAGTNLYNDAADGAAGHDGSGRIGPPRLTALGWATPEQVKVVALGSFALAAIIGSYLVFIGGWTIAVIGLIAILLGYGYSGGPMPISHSPLGEVFVISFFGIIAVAGTYFLQAGHITTNTIIIGLCIGLMAAGVLMVNNARDRDQDIKAGRRTVAILIGPRASGFVYGFLVLAPFALLLANELLGSGTGNWLAILPAPYAAFLVWQFFKADNGMIFNAILVQTAKLQFAFALLYALGLVALKTGHAG